MMAYVNLRVALCKRNTLAWARTQCMTYLHVSRVKEYSSSTLVGNKTNENGRETSLAMNLASLVDESIIMDQSNLKPKGRMEFKRYFELRIKKRVKEQYADGKFCSLMAKVIANHKTLEDAYNCIRLNSNIDVTSPGACISFEAIARELGSGNFDVESSSYSISTRGSRKEVLVLPDLKLKIVQEAIRIALEVVYRPHFSRVSHGCRSGRGHFTALKYVKEMPNPDWWFTLHVTKKLDAQIFARLISVMGENIEDPYLFAFLQSMFDAQVLNLEFGGFAKGHGLPQEGLLSPILMNIYLDHLDSELYRLSMTFEVLNPTSHRGNGVSSSNLRGWFRRQLNGGDLRYEETGKSPVRVYSCRVMDEIILGVSGPEVIALNLKSQVIKYLQDTLYLDADDQTNILPCNGPKGIRFLGLLIRRRETESPAVRAVHKLKDKVQLFASQKEAAWKAGTIRIGKKWLAHGLKKVKESEIKHLADKTSTLSQISRYRKDGMKTDHWYKFLLKIWIHNVNAKAAEREEMILSKLIAEPALPQELTNSFNEFQECVKEYVSSETASTISLLPNPSESVAITEIIAPVDAIKKRLLRYGLTTSRGCARSVAALILQDSDQIVHWFSGIASRWLKWYSECSNFDEIKVIIGELVRKSCIRTLATKYRIHETDIEKRFSEELNAIPLNEDTELELANETSNSHVYDSNEALTYGVMYSGACLLTLARITSPSRPCNCFVMGCFLKAPCVYTLNVMERQRFPGWKTGFSNCIHPSLNKRRIGLCKKHLIDLYTGHISLQSINFGAWTSHSSIVED